MTTPTSIVKQITTFHTQIESHKLLPMCCVDDSARVKKKFCKVETYKSRSADKPHRAPHCEHGHKGNEIEISFSTNDVGAACRRASESLFECNVGRLASSKGFALFGCKTAEFMTSHDDSGSIQKWWQLIWLIFMHQSHSGLLPLLENWLYSLPSVISVRFSR